MAKIYISNNIIIVTLCIPFIQFSEKNFVLRDEQSYEYHCKLLDGDLSESDSVTYGINHRSVLNDLWFSCGKWPTATGCDAFAT